MRARRKDSNHTELKKALEDMGATVFDVYQLPGALDVIIGYAGIDQRAEIKDGMLPQSKRKLTDAEHKTIIEWRGRTPVVLQTIADCVILIKQMRQDAST